MFLILSCENEELKVLDTSDMIIEYLSVSDVIKALHQGIEFANVNDNYEFLKYLEFPMPHKVQSIHISDISVLSRLGNTVHCVFHVVSGMQFKQSFVVTNKKFDFGCKYKKGSGLQVVHKGIQSDLGLCIFNGFIYNKKSYASDIGFEMDTLSYIGYDTRHQRLELVYSDVGYIPGEDHTDAIIFTDKGILYGDVDGNTWRELESKKKGITLSDFRRKILLG